MSCNGCYNGCVEISSDNCIKYMGPPIASLGIDTGDSLAVVEAAIIQYLLTALDGTGILPVIPPASICALIDGYLPATPTLNDVIDATFQAICSLQTQVDAVVADIADINSAYTEGCLTVTDNTDTHEVLQETINQLCTIVNDVTALTANFNNYVAIADINDYIAAYIAANLASSNLIYTKMVPYTIVEFYGDLTGKFDATGKGMGDWDKIYLCNGQNGTPDKRGRITVGTIMPGGGVLNAAVDPATGNPNYSLGDTGGTNSVILTTAQMPLHTHPANTVVADPGHKHLFGADNELPGYPYKDLIPFDMDNPSPMTNIGKNYYTRNVDGSDTPQEAGISVSTTLTAMGSSEAHTNIPPVIACHYIMYIP